MSYPEQQFQPPIGYPAMAPATKATQGAMKRLAWSSERKLVAESERKPHYLNFRTPLLTARPQNTFIVG